MIALSSGAGITVQEWLETTADWYLISQTTHILMSESSFSQTAAMYGGTVPDMVGEACSVGVAPWAAG